MIKTEERTEIRPMIAEDMLWILRDGIKENKVEAYGDKNIEELAIENENSGLSVTGLLDGKIVGCGGIRKLWNGVGEVWLMLSPDTCEYPLRAGHVILKGFKGLIETGDFNRLQGWCRTDFTKAHTLFRHLGFKAEGMARQYTPDGVDCILYARLK